MPVHLTGFGVSKGIAIGKARILQRGQLEILEYALPKHHIEDEVSRFSRALERAKAHLRATQEEIPSGTPEEIAAFIDSHLLMLEDATLATAPIELIRSRRCNAEWALKLQQDALEKVFDAMDDPYLKTRRDDVAHVVQRVQHYLALQDSQDRPQDAPDDDEPRIVFASDISPSDLLMLSKQQVVAIVTESGGPLAHTAILARNLGLPAVVGVRRAHQYVAEDEVVVVDGKSGVVAVGLDEKSLEWYQRERRHQQRLRSALKKLKDEPAITQDGVQIHLFANIDLPADLPGMRKVGADGVGLFRTEFLYMNRQSIPDEEEQFRVYRNAVKRTQGKPLTLRTLDLGADKGLTSDCGTCSPLGLRAIRLCLKEPELFNAQLRAILRASAYGPIRLLIPMITNLHEVHQIRKIITHIMGELEQEGIPYDPNIPVGGMIEVPAAALCADSMSIHLDFLSIGTNDLIQYTLATDRADESVGHLYDPMHPAVLRLILNTIDAGNRHGKPVTMCGEMAGDPLFTRLLLAMGLTEFSVPPVTLLEIKDAVMNTDVGSIRPYVDKIIACHNANDIAEAIEEINSK